MKFTAIAFVATISSCYSAEIHPKEVTCIFDHVSDGDTLEVFCPQNEPPQQEVHLRVYQLDTPESRLAKPGSKVDLRSVAKCEKEARLGVSAKAWAKGLFEKGDKIRYTWVRAKDPRGRVIAKVKLKSGFDWAEAAIRSDHGAFYDPDAKGTYAKPDWCK
jgi:endonuclease YncB( thermonuclease family)